MASEAQVAANRRNARASTGPAGAAGIARASRNATRHGITARALVLSAESFRDFANFHVELRRAYAPADAVEKELVERIVVTSWRLRRAWRTEAAMIDEAARRPVASGLGAAPASEDETARPPADDIAEPEALHVAALEAAGPPNPVVWPDGLRLVGRYETMLERFLHRTATELHARQAARRGEAALLKRRRDLLHAL